MLGQGSFGKVFLAQHINNQVKKDQADIENKMIKRPHQIQLPPI
jgi:hypothetical protein